MAKRSDSGHVGLGGLILAVLECGPSHGYAVAREIERRSVDALSFGEGTLYPALKSLEAQGFVVSHWDTDSKAGAARRIYQLTPAGHRELARIRDAWVEYTASVGQVLLGQARFA